MTDPEFIRMVRAGAAVLLGVAWGLAVAIGVVYSFVGGGDPKWIGSDGMTYFMPGLTALVGGVVATAFGVPTPKDTPPGPTERLSNLVAGEPVGRADGIRRWVGRGYILVYLLLGALAAFTWVVKGGDTVNFVRTLAPAWGGLILPIAASFFSEP
jgi:hypothetical protein